eukprot:TRINITY_DN9113_c0_g1_i5.p1 TRINITY_DN9113_c0_g1~~TRINITY_DN9113_c0_g1_i5.p1  ORF type:complete len:345 (+),score=-49.68 TRINITY_DN9113_c0_g1_i5:287-1321(+)
MPLFLDTNYLLIKRNKKQQQLKRVYTSQVRLNSLCQLASTIITLYFRYRILSIFHVTLQLSSLLEYINQLKIQKHNLSNANIYRTIIQISRILQYNQQNKYYYSNISGNTTNINQNGQNIFIVIQQVLILYISYKNNQYYQYSLEWIKQVLSFKYSGIKTYYYIFHYTQSILLIFIRMDKTSTIIQIQFQSINTTYIIRMDKVYISYELNQYYQYLLEWIKQILLLYILLYPLKNMTQLFKSNKQKNRLQTELIQQQLIFQIMVLQTYKAQYTKFKLKHQSTTKRSLGDSQSNLLFLTKILVCFLQYPNRQQQYISIVIQNTYIFILKYTYHMILKYSNSVDIN